MPSIPSLLPMALRFTGLLLRIALHLHERANRVSSKGSCVDPCSNGSSRKSGASREAAAVRARAAVTGRRRRRKAARTGRASRPSLHQEELPLNSDTPSE